MILEKIKKISKPTSYELFVSRWILFILPPVIYVYSLLIFYFNPKAHEITGVKEILLLFIFVCALASYSKKKIIINNYAWIAFIPMVTFNHYLIYILYLNEFSLDYLLGTYVITFGIMMLVSSRFFMVLFCSTQLIHIIQKVYISDLERMETAAIIMSMTGILTFSFIVLNGFVRYRNFLGKIKLKLEDTVQDRTKELENRAQELTEKNEDLRQFAYVASHDLKRPLRNIYTITHWIIDDYADLFNDDIKNNLELIKEQTLQMDLLVDGILNYSIPSDNMLGTSDIHLDVVVKKIVSSYTSETIEINVLKKLPDINFNETQIVQIFENLILNAIKYNNKKLVSIEIDYTNKKDEYQFSVKDNGLGIKKEYHDKIFQLFQRLEQGASNQNIGIGLAIVKKSVCSNGGKIWLESELDIGSTFYFTILKKSS